MRGHVMAPPNRATGVRPGRKTQLDSSEASTNGSLGVRSHQRKRVFSNMYCWTRELLAPVWTPSAEVVSDDVILQFKSALKSCRIISFYSLNQH
ncbi:hypothetical protein PoB_002736900 [Plakobranchus ocellatus]|uniref:Uncharacterized protein n=1 Tax=Plakobranchus ocellatus TaxID=259542 RepID=A0AAV4A2Q5_9GAST|nr:hypothetical protein PoB_002736900 [Plakobranchus ocellatus]